MKHVQDIKTNDSKNELSRKDDEENDMDKQDDERNKSSCNLSYATDEKLEGKEDVLKNCNSYEENQGSAELHKHHKIPGSKEGQLLLTHNVANNRDGTKINFESLLLHNSCYHKNLERHAIHSEIYKPIKYIGTWKG